MITVLYVDDDPDLLKLGILLSEKSEDIDLDIARSAFEALRKTASRTYECIISDYRMPGMDGIEFLKQLRFNGDTTPFILFTSYDDDPEVKEETYRHGAFGVVDKDLAGKNAIHTLIRTIYWATLYRIHKTKGVS